MKNDYIRAMGDYTRAIQVQPDHFAAYCKRSALYSTQGHHDKAIADGAKARELKPDNMDANRCSGEAYHNSGYALLKKKEYDKALTHLTLAIKLYIFAHDNGKLDATAFQVHKEIGNTYFPSDKDFVKDFVHEAHKTKTAHLKALLAVASFTRGNVYAQKSEKTRAIADYSVGIELQPNNYNAYIVRGGLYFQLGVYDRAIEDYSRLIEIKPTDEVGYRLRGEAHKANGDAASANADFAVAVQLRNSQ